jgi:hypothetical protein
VISVHILCLDDCFTTTNMPQPTEITQFIFGQPLRYKCDLSVPPLQNAIALAKAMRANYVIKQLVKYYHDAWVNRSRLNEASWFVNLYKVRDLLKKHYRGEKQAQTTLCVCPIEWKKVGTLLNNNDYRHAEITGKPPVVSLAEIDEVYTIARRWVAAYLKTKSLTII